MKFLFSCLFSVLSISAMAQVSVGFRAGATRHFSTDYDLKDAITSGAESPITVWDKELFGRYRYSRWCFEMSFNHRQENRRWITSYWEPYAINRPFPHDEYAKYEAKMNFFIISSTILYRLNTWGKNNRWSNYAGINISQQFEHGSSQGYIQSSDGSTRPTERSRSHDTQLWHGITHSLTCDVNKNLQLSSTLFGRYLFGISYPDLNMQIGLQVGASYRITP